MDDLQGLPEKRGTVFIIDSYTRLEEAEGNSPGQRPVVNIALHICVAL